MSDTITPEDAATVCARVLSRNWPLTNQGAGVLRHCVVVRGADPKDKSKIAKLVRANAGNRLRIDITMPLERMFLIKLR